jgi:acyl dehydratase
MEAYMKVFESVQDLRSAVGEHIGYSGWHTVSQEQINAFADATGDHQWIHVDPSAAAQGPFGTTIAHGFLMLSLIPMLASQVSKVDGVRMGVNYGLNKVRFPAPLPSGSAVRAGVRMLSLEDIPGGVHIVNEVTIEREGGDKPCCVAETVVRYYT